MGTAEVLAEQVKATYSEYVRVYVGSTAYDNTGVVKYVKEKTEPYTATYEILLDNADQALNDADFRGQVLLIGWGFIIGGTPDYINIAPAIVVNQLWDSRPGKLALTLQCRGYLDMMDEDRASQEYTADDTTHPSELIDDMMAGTIVFGTDWTARTTNWTAITLATAIDFYHPGNWFQVYQNNTRLSWLRKLLDNSYVFPRVDSSGVVHFIKPVTTGTTYDYQYVLSGGHTFFSKLKANRLAIPGGATVYGGDWDDDTQAYDYSGSYGGGGTTQFFYIPNLASDAECTAVATAIMSVFTQETETCVATVPMNCTALLYDYVKITDARNGDTAVGNIGQIIRIFDSSKPSNERFLMQIKYGGWRSDRKVSQLINGKTKDTSSTFKGYIIDNCPETYLLINDYFDYQTFDITTTFYLKAYGIYKAVPTGTATVKIQILMDDIVQWEQEATDWQKIYNDLVICTGTGTIKFRVINEGDDPAYVNGMITYKLG
jgi:hypothetical protein